MSSEHSATPSTNDNCPHRHKAHKRRTRRRLTHIRPQPLPTDGRACGRIFLFPAPADPFGVRHPETDCQTSLFQASGEPEERSQKLFSISSPHSCGLTSFLCFTLLRFCGKRVYTQSSRPLPARDIALQTAGKCPHSPWIRQAAGQLRLLYSPCPSCYTGREGK